MIADRLENRILYPFGSAWEAGFSFLATLAPETEDGEYRLIGDDVFARVMTYETRDPADGILEAHRRYVDIQAVLTGREGVRWHPVDRLIPKRCYDPETDAEFYRVPNGMQGGIDLKPGLFAVFFPGDAHMTSLIIGEAAERVRKVVVKIRLELLRQR